MEKKAILLARVSTEEQDIESQKDELIEFAKSKGYTNYIIIVNKESAIKLSEEERLGLSEMKEIINNDKSIDAVFVWEISRLARTQLVLFSVRDLLIKNNINLYIKDKNYQLLKDDGTIDENTSILFTLYAYFAESEMKLKKERFKRAKKRNAKIGKYPGGPIKFGYSVDKNNYYIINEDEASIIILIYDLYLSGLSEVKVTKELNERGINLTIDKVKNILHAKQFTGSSDKYGNERTYPIIIDEETYNKAREIALKNNSTINKAKSVYYCRGLIKCFICKRNYIASSSSVTYICTSNRDEKYIMKERGKCGAGGININLLDSIVWDIAKEEEFDSSIYTLKSNTIKYNEIIEINLEKIVVANEALIKLNDKKERNSNMYFDGDISKDKYEINKNKINEEGNKLKTKIAKYNKEINEYKKLINETNKSINFIDSANSKGELIENITDDKLIYDIVHKYISVIMVNDIVKYESKSIVIILKNNETIKLKVNIHTKKLSIWIEPIGWMEREYKYIERFKRKTKEINDKKEYNKNYFKENSDKIKANKKEWRERHIDEVREKQKIYNKRYLEKKAKEKNED